jgi:hypothetical protein
VRHGSDRTYAELARAWRSLRAQGVRVREIACWGVARTLLVAECGPHDAPTIHISAGVHGDEPAPPWALYALVRDGLLDSRFAYRIWPCLNPSGYEQGTRTSAEGEDINRGFSRGGTTPESRAVLTANRDRRFALALDLHEDFEADGSYLFEPLREGCAARYAEPVVRALDDAGLAVQVIPEDFDLGAPPGTPIEDAYTFLRGAVLVDYEAELRIFPGFPITIAQLYRGTPATMTFETPLLRSWDERIAAHRVAVAAALAVTPGGRLPSSANLSRS